MPGPGRKPAIEPTFKMPPLWRARLSAKASDRSVSARTLTSIIASSSVALAQVGEADQAEAGIVDHVLRLGAVRAQFVGDFLRGAGVGKIGGDDDRPAL